MNLQLAQEEQWKQDMLDKYRHSLEDGGTQTPVITNIVEEHAIWFKDAIENYLEQNGAMKARMPEWAQFASCLSPIQLSYIIIDTILSASFHAAYRADDRGNADIQWSVPTAQYIAREIGNRVWTLAAWMESKSQNLEFYKHQSKFFKNWDTRRRRAFIKKVGTMPEASFKQKSDFGHAMLLLAEAAGLVEILIHREVKTKKRGSKDYITTKRVGLNQELLTYIVTQVEEYAQRLDPNHLPMICKPVDYTKDEMGGFMDWTLRGKNRVLHHDGPIRGQDVDAFGSITLKVINALQQTEWRINTEVLDVMQHFWTNELAIGSAPSSSASELEQMSPYPEDDKVAQALWIQARKVAWDTWHKETNQRLQHALRLKEAEKLRKFVLWHAYFCDFRGRYYSDSYLLHPQGGDLDKALIKAAIPAEVTSAGLYWIKVNLANLMGMDKCPFDERVAWVDNQMDLWRAIASDPIGMRASYEDDAVKKNATFQRLAAILDLIKAIDTGKTEVPVQIDGACNGVQHWAALTRDEVVGKQVNLYPAPKPQDVYQVVADRCTELCAAEEDTYGWHHRFLTEWQGSIPRKATKRAVMCDPYGISKYRVEYYIEAEGHLNWIQENKDRRFAAKRLANLIENAKLEVMEHCNHGKQFVKKLCGWVASEIDQPISFVTPAGFMFVNNYNKTNTYRSQIQIWNKNFDLTSRPNLWFQHYTNEYDSDGAISGMPPNFVHALDAAHMSLVIDALCKMGIDFFSFIHDSFGVLAPYIPMLRDITKETFYEIHSQDQLERLLKRSEELVGKPLPDDHPAWHHFQQRGQLDIQQVLESEYLFG